MSSEGTHEDTKEETVPTAHKHENCDSDDAADPESKDAAGGAAPKANRGEKKCRKAMQKLGMKPVPGVSRVTMRRAKNMLFLIENPEVLKTPNADIYVVLGVAKFEDLSQVAANTEVEKFKADQPKKDEAQIETIKEEAEDEDDEDESGLNAEDIKNVMEHSKVSKAKAIKALRASNGDTVEAILTFS